MRAWLGLTCATMSLVYVLAAAWVEKAHACGGTFCDRAPPQMPPMTVDQSGENILFVRLNGHIEAHVQIRYQGDPERFAWLVPMPSVPEVRIGSQPLFDALLWDSMPLYGIRTMRTDCEGEVTQSESSGCGGGEASPTRAGVGTERDSEANMMMDPIGETVGTFDVTILQPSTTEEVLQWLMDNDFELPERTAELIAPYVDAGSVFAAIRLVPGAGVQDIHPIVFRYEGERPLIPIQLTAVAATEDMKIRTFFLGEQRVVPSNFRHVVVNQARLSWPAFAFDYENVVAQAVDATGDGKGFVTEYAGPSSLIDGADILREDWDAAPLRGSDPEEAMQELMAQGQIICNGGVCAFPHPLVLPLLQRYLPAPAGMRESDFYGCLSCNRDQIDLERWDADALADEYQERVIEPGQYARQLLSGNPYLTRMLSFISPDEMTSDPAFHERAELGDREREHWAERTIACGEPVTLRLPDGRVVEESFSGWVGSGADMPAAERIEMVPLTGEVAVVASFEAEIDAEVEAWNATTDEVSGDLDGEAAATLARDATDGRRSRVGCRVHGGAAQQLWMLALCLGWLAYRRRPMA